MLKKQSNKPPLNVALAYQGFVEEPVPSVIFDSIESGAAKRTTLIALLLSAMLTGVVGSTLYTKAKTSTANLITQQLPAKDLAVSAHKAYAADVVHPVQVNADDLDHLHNWLSYRMGKELSLTALSDAGYTLLGASAIPDGATASSMAVYENTKKERVSVFTRYFAGAYEKSEVKVAQSGKLNTLSWEQNGAQHTMVSDVNSSTLRNIVDKYF